MAVALGEAWSCSDLLLALKGESLAALGSQQREAKFLQLQYHYHPSPHITYHRPHRKNSEVALFYIFSGQAKNCFKRVFKVMLHKCFAK